MLLVLHLRITVPPDLSAEVVDLLERDMRVTGLVVLPGAARQPVGDAVLCDVAREAASEILERLAEIGVNEHGSLALEQVDASPTRRARVAEQAAPGAPDDGVVWPMVREQAEDGVRPSWSLHAFLTLATLLAAVAVVLDSSVLVIGAMVLGPEFAPVVAVALALVVRDRVLLLGALRQLAVGFLLAVTVTVLLAVLAGAAGWVSLADLLAPRPQTGFIWTPDRWSFVVALLAGAAGVLSLTSGRSNVLVGVFISVTTVPAAGNLALGLAFLDASEVKGSAAQLGLNLAGLVVAGVTTLLLQRLVWRGVRRHRRRRRHDSAGKGRPATSVDRP
jgi:uncharacterized hydrophobic protein (TIGR00271 family)